MFIDVPLVHRGSFMGKKKKPSEEVQLRVPLKGDLLAKFNALKERFGLETNTEAFRLILNKVYQSIFAEAKEAGS